MTNAHKTKWLCYTRQLPVHLKTCTDCKSSKAKNMMSECTKVMNFVNPLPNNKILDMTKLKAFADDKLNVTKMKISLYDRVENTKGEGENAGIQHFLLLL